MLNNILLTHERVDDIPFLLGVLQRLRVPEVVDQVVGRHGHHQGLSAGWLTTVWLVYSLSVGDHRKSAVRDWVARHQHTLAALLGQPLRSTDFTDDRLGLLLRRLGRVEAWAALEAALWTATMGVYDLDLTSIRLDSTSSYGYHTPSQGGLMQLGHSKDHRPDLPQVKLMAAAAEPSGHLIGCDVVAGHRGDVELYRPLIQRVRQMLGRTGLLFVGDAAMSARAIRAEVVAAQDYYLTVWAATQGTRDHKEAWVETAVEGEPTLHLIWRDETCLGAGYETTRQESVVLDGQSVTWTERVLVVRSHALAAQQTSQLAARLAKAERTVRTLTPPPTSGRRVYRDEASLQQAVETILQRYEVVGLLRVEWTHQTPPTVPTARYVITTVTRDEVAIRVQEARLGWRVYLTNLPDAAWSLAHLVRHYRGGWVLERDFHLVKDRPLGISPLYVRCDDQIAGLTHLLTLGVRVMTLIETQVRRGLAQDGHPLVGLYPGQPTRATARPTAPRLLKAFEQAQITLTRIQLGPTTYWQVTPLPDTLQLLLRYLGLSPTLYTRLADHPP